MKLALRTAGLCASGVFLLAALPAFFAQVAPMGLASGASVGIRGIALAETLVVSLTGAAMAGVLGYWIGDILAHPQRSHASANPRLEKVSVPPEEAYPETVPDEPDQKRDGGMHSDHRDAQRSPR